MDEKSIYSISINNIVAHHYSSEKILDIHEFEQGFNNVAFRVKTNRRTVVIKLIKRKDSEVNATHEAWAFSTLKKKFPQLPLPATLAFNNEKKICEYAYCIVTLLPGKPLNTRLKEITNYKSLFKQIGEIRGMIHSTKYAKFGKFDAKHNIIQEDLLTKIFEKTDEKLSRLKLPKEYITFWNTHKILLSTDSQPRLIQGDAGQSNYLVTKSNTHPKITGLIDFEFVRAGRRMNDVITFYNHYEKIDEYLSAIEIGYVKYCKLPANWKLLFYLYAFARFVNEIDKIDTFTFRNKTPTQMQRIRRIVKARCKRYLKITVSNFAASK